MCDVCWQMQKLEAEARQAEQRQQGKMLLQWRQAHCHQVTDLQTRLKGAVETMGHMEHGQQALTKQGLHWRL